MRNEQRLRRRRDFTRAYRKSRANGNQLLVLRVLPGDNQATRFGFVVGKVVGNAVVRNRVKRRLRAIAGSLDAVQGLDVVVGARKPAADATYQSLHHAFIALMERSRAIRRPAPAQENQ